jgi:hypothetical protein
MNAKTVSTLEKIQLWYKEQCDSEWEHEYGLSIDTLDNPGWTVSINLVGTRFENHNIICFSQNFSDNDWVVCEVKDKKFIGNGDPLKLEFILETFLNFISKT